MRRHVVADSQFTVLLRELLEQRGLSFRALAARTYYSKSYLHDLVAGKRPPTLDVARRIDEVLGAGGRLVAMVDVARLTPRQDELDELAALELSRRVAASDVSDDTLDRLESAVDEIATSYGTTPSEVLLQRCRQQLGYLGRIMDARKTLRQQRRLLIAGGWLSLLAATAHIDLRHPVGARARLSTAIQLAQHTDHTEIEGWCLETQAWEVLTSGDYPRAVALSRQAQAVAPRASSAHIQATAQEARAWARMHQREQTRDALERVSRLTGSLAVPDRPEHHYRYDPDKALAYTATTLAWSGDPAAEEFARTAVRHLESPANGILRPRRVASAKLDLALALLAAGKPDEAAAVAAAAITSGRVVPSNWWRATEIVTATDALGLREATELREVYEAHRPSPPA